LAGRDSIRTSNDDPSRWVIQVSEHGIFAFDGPARLRSRSGSHCPGAIDTFDLQHFSAD
jgi:hypothetical protein